MNLDQTNGEMPFDLILKEEKNNECRVIMPR